MTAPSWRSWKTWAALAVIGGGAVLAYLGYIPADLPLRLLELLGLR